MSYIYILPFIHGISSQMTIVTKDLTVEYLLRVTSVTEEDMGDYYCKAEYPQGNQISQPAYLIIEGMFVLCMVVTKMCPCCFL